MRSIFSRFATLNDRLQWHLDNVEQKSNNLSDTIELIYQSLKAIAHLTEEQRIIFLWLAVCGAYPKEQEIKKTAFYLMTQDSIGLADFFAAHPTFKRNNSDIYEVSLVFPEPNTLVADISHTAEYPYTSGIQRVVRKLIQNLISQKRPVSFLTFSEETKAFAVLSTSEIQTLLNTIRPHGKVGLTIRYRWIKRILGEKLSWKVASLKAKILHLLSLGFVRNFLSTILNGISIKLGMHVKKPLNVLVLHKSNILIPELIPDGDRLSLWLVLLKYMDNRSTLIIYDFIPIYNPEFCVIVNEFVAYLQLLRHVDQISCISEHVASDAKNFIANIPRLKPAKIQTHYLGADLHKTDFVDFESSPYDFLKTSKPVALCVGTFEPRKNQLAIARAAVRLMQEGLDFKMVFVGNPGWLNNEILSELDSWKKLGFDIVTIGSGSDDLLDALFKKAKFTVFCSFVEGFGLPIVESIYYSKPCVISNVGSMIEIGDKIGGCVPVDPNSVDSIAAGMKELLQNSKVITSCNWPSWRDYAIEIFEFSFKP